jgi:hypothetical protein
MSEINPEPESKTEAEPGIGARSETGAPAKPAIKANEKANEKTKGELWRARIFKIIIGFVITGTIVLGLAVALLSKVFSDILSPEQTNFSAPAPNAVKPGR